MPDVSQLHDFADIGLMPDARRWLVLIPNALSLGRLVLAACFPLAGVGWRPAFVVMAGISDFADGYIARRFGLSTWVGGLLDSIADKAFALSVLGILTLEGQLAIWQAALLLARDLTVAAIAGYAALRQRWRSFRKMPARPAGKATTAAMFLLLLAIVFQPTPEPVRLILLAITCGLSVASSMDYLLVFAGKLGRTAVIR